MVERVELVNFMCHKYLEVKLGPRINFIIGHNGSGKSAILTAVTICLGGRAQSTQRAQSLRGFIREGATAAQVTVRIRNRGPEAFKPYQVEEIQVWTNVAKQAGIKAGE